MYDLSGDNTGRTTVKGGYGKFFENIRTLTNFGERWWHQGQSIIIDNPDFLDPLGGRSREEYLSSAPPNITVLDNDYEQPYAHHLNLGVAHQFRDDMALSLDLTRVATRADAQRNVNINYPVDGVRPWAQFNRVNTSYSFLDHDYQAFYAKFEKRYADGWQFLVSYTLAKTETTELWTRGTEPSGWESDFPGYTRVTHPGGTDRRHRLVSSAILVLPGDIRVSTILDYRSPLAVLVTSGTNLNGDGYSGDLAPGFNAGNSYGCRNLDLGPGQRLPPVHRPDSGDGFRLRELPERGLPCFEELLHQRDPRHRAGLPGAERLRPGQLRECQQQPAFRRLRRQRKWPGGEHQRPLPPVRSGSPLLLLAKQLPFRAGTSVPARSGNTQCAAPTCAKRARQRRARTSAQPDGAAGLERRPPVGTAARSAADGTNPTPPHGVQVWERRCSHRHSGGANVEAALLVISRTSSTIDPMGGEPH